jgi:enamine deaminase RidA (YjgF/YER057c/UK114 family)
MGPLVLLACLSRVAATGVADESLPRYIESDEATGTSSAVVVGDWPLVHTAQLLPVDAGGEPVAGGMALQLGAVLDRLADTLNGVNSRLDRTVKLNLYLASGELTTDALRVLAERFRGRAKPALSLVVTRLPQAGALVAADAVATTDLNPGRSVRVTARRGPGGGTAAVVPAGTRIYVAGQAERADTVTEATRKTLASLRATLQYLGRGDGDIVQLKAFLTPMTAATDVQREIAAFFGRAPMPPVVLVEWRSAATTPIEIELIAWGGANHSGDAVEYLTPPGMTTSPIYSRVARVHHSRSIYVSGLFAARGPGEPPSGESEVKQCFTSLDRILQETGSDLRHLVKATYYVASDAASQKLNELRPGYYDPRRPPSASKAAVAGVGREGLGLTMDMIAVPAITDERPEYGPPQFGHGLSAEDAAAGWISLFDGQTTFGWRDARVENGALLGGVTTSDFGNGELHAQFERGGTIAIAGREVRVPDGDFTLAATVPKSDPIGPIRLGEAVRVRRLALRPRELRALFNGQDMTGWQRIDHPRIGERNRPVWQVADRSLHATGGPGCIEYQGGRFGDLVLQLDVRTRVRHANGGVFFRAIPGDFMNGYEAQVFNRGEDGNPARPATWSTGGIDDRQNARRLVSRDGQFFRMTIVARGPHIATWVNGYQQTDWTDTRPAHENPRQGLRVEPGVIQLQAHDPASDLEFRNIAAAAW